MCSDARRGHRVKEASRTLNDKAARGPWTRPIRPIWPVGSQYSPPVSAQPPSGTVTFLFTAIEDATRLWESIPADMTSAVHSHDVVLGAAVERHGGHVFGAGGDGFRIAFPSAVDAVTAAVESQRELAAVEDIPFAVRMALHTGEVSERDRNYSGTEVNRAARLVALAHGGQVLASDATEMLVRSRVVM